MGIGQVRQRDDVSAAVNGGSSAECRGKKRFPRELTLSAQMMTSVQHTIPQARNGHEQDDGGVPFHSGDAGRGS